MVWLIAYKVAFQEKVERVFATVLLVPSDLKLHFKRRLKVQGAWLTYAQLYTLHFKRRLKVMLRFHRDRSVELISCISREG